MQLTPRIPIPMLEIEAFCKKWKITEFSLFGSVLREDFGPDSDVDVLVSFDESARWRAKHLIEMRDELQALFGRDVDILTRRGVDMMRNHLRRDIILGSSSRLYAR